ncbi:MAG: COG1361 S-layer family protein, partial [Candidatus Bathyarchaeota archaeon]
MNKMNKFSVILLIATLMATQITTVNAADSSILLVSTENIYLVAGQENSITINLKNTGDFNLINIESFLTSAVPGISVLSEAHNVVNSIDDGKTKSYEPTLFVSEYMGLGVYSLSLTVIYKSPTEIMDSSITIPINVIVDESYVPKLKFTPSQESIKVKSGSENGVEFGFTNNWDQDAVDLEFTVSSSTSSITIIDNINTMLETLAPGESVTLSPVVSITEGIALGTYTITATASYRDVEGNRYHQTFTLPLNLDSATALRNTILTIDSMEVLQESIRPGDIFTMRLTVKCSGAESYNLLSNVAFGSLSSISPISPTTISLGDLSIDDTVTVSYQLLASGDISAGQYPVISTITYTNSRGETGTLSETFTILVDGLIDFELLDVPTEKVPVGETSELEADLLLIGTESVQFVAIVVVEDGVIERVSG